MSTATADGLAERPSVPVFAGDRLTLQSVRTCQQVFSAAFIAHVEVSYDDEAHKNELCTPVPHPNTHLDFLRTTLENGMNGFVWGQDPELQKWLIDSRLDGFTQAPPADGSGEVAEATQRIAASAGRAIENLKALMA